MKPTKPTFTEAELTDRAYKITQEHSNNPELEPIAWSGALAKAEAELRGQANEQPAPVANIVALPAPEAPTVHDSNQPDSHS